jgi:hypothetical protein
MNLLLLPGGSKRNKAWITEIEKTFAPNFNQTHIRSYSHWDTEESEIDLTNEVGRISEELVDFEPYCIFAKSAGTIVACKASAESVLSPKACVFAGFPLAMVINHDLPIDKWLMTTNFPITILQNNNDPLGSYDDVRGYFKNVGRQNVSVHPLPGDTHDYLDFVILNKFTAQLLKS